MRRDMVFKYGPVEPNHSMLIKYGPPTPRPQIVDKYAPLEPNQPKVGSEDSGDKQVKAVLKQIVDCLKKIQKLLNKAEAKIIAEELGLCIAELSLLYLKLNDLQKPGGNNQTIEWRPGRRGNDFVILYISISPSRPAKKK